MSYPSPMFAVIRPSMPLAMVAPLALLVGTACGAQPQSDAMSAGGALTAAGGSGGTADSGGDESTAGGSGQDGAPGDGPDDLDDDVGDDAPAFDVGGDSFCQSKAAGIYCDDQTSVLCDGNGGVEDTTLCTPEICVEGEGCVTCSAGQWTCKGPRVMACNTQAVPFWEQTQVCDPGAQEYCDISVAGCSPLSPIGTIEPTGEYYLYSTFSATADGFNTISDVDSDQNRIWFTGYSGNQLVIGRYDVTLLDTDGDGMLEPNQHPDYAEEMGPIEERVFTFVQSYPIANNGSIPHQMELHATPTTVSYGSTVAITEFDIATGVTSVVAPAPPWLAGLQYKYLAFLGYDDIHGVWYSGNESARRVFQYDADTMTWGYAFEFPVLAGDHMDGMDVVTDTSTGIPYVYVSDMTSNFIGQYRHDPELGWVQENMFTYAENSGLPVEGFGYGALSHFWVGAWSQNSFYEIGGGDLTEFLDPEG